MQPAEASGPRRQPRRPTARRWRRWPWGLPLAALLAGLWALSYGDVADRLRPRLAASASARLGRPCQLGHLSVSLFPPTLRLQGLVLPPAPDSDGGAPGSRAHLRADEVEAVLRLWPAWPDLLGLQRLQVRGLRGGLDLRPAAEGSMPSPSPSPGRSASPATPWRLPLDIRRLQVRDAQLSLQMAGLQLQVEVSSLCAEPTLSGRHLTLDASVVAAESLSSPASPAPAAALQLTAAVDLQGSLARPGRLHLASLELLADPPGAAPPGPRPSPVVARALVTGDLQALAPGAALVADLRVDADVAGSLAWLARLRPSLQLGPAAEAAGGRLGLRLHIAGPLGPELVGDGGFALVDAQAGGRPAGDLQADLQLSRRGLTLAALDWQLAGIGQLTGSCDVAATSALPVSAQLRLHGLDLAALAAAKAAGPARLAGSLSGDLQGVGTLRPLMLALDGVVAYQGLRLGEAAAPVWAPPAGRLSGAVRLVPGQLELAQGIWTPVPGSHLRVDGVVPLAAGRALALAARTQAPLELARLGALGGVAIGGLAGLDIQVGGELAAPRLQVAFTADSLQIADMRLGAAEGEVVLHGPRLTLAPLRVALGGGELRGSLALNLPPAAGETVGLQTELEVVGVDAAMALGLFNLAPILRPHLGARLWGDLALGGSLARPSGVARLRAPAVRLGPLQLGGARWTLKFGRADTFVRAKGHFLPPLGRLSAAFTWRLAGEMDLVVQARELQLLDLWGAGPRRPGAAVGATGRAAGRPGGPSAGPSADSVAGPAAGEAADATADIDIALAGPPEGLAGNISIIAHRLRGGGTLLDGLRLQGSAHAGVWRPRISRGLAPPWGEAEVALRDNVPATLRLRLPELRLADLLPPGSELSGEAAVEVAAHGPLAAPQQLAATAHVGHLVIGYRGLSMRAEAPMRVTLRRGRWRLGDGRPVLLQAAGPMALGVSLQGGADARGRLLVDAELVGDLGFLSLVAPQVAAAHGSLAADVSVRGPLGGIQVSGRGRIDAAGIEWVDGSGFLAAPVEQLSARWLLSGRRLEVTQATAKVGPGRLWMLGEAQLGDRLRPPRLNLQANIKRVPVRPAPDLDVQVTGELQLAGPIDSLSLQGRLNLDALRYSARLDLERMLPARGAPPLRVASLSRLQPVRFAVHMVGRNNLVVASNVLDAELQGDLMLTGTSERVGLVGSMNSLWARARYRDNLFVVSRASIDFLDEYRISPEVNVQASTRACNMLAEVTLHGDSRGLQVLPHGQDEHGAVDAQDVLSCLQFGLRLNDFMGNQRTPASFGDALPGSLDALWTVSGLDDKIKKLFPIDVDELRVTSAWSQVSQRTTARVLVGKQLGSAWTARYSRSLDENNDQALTLEHQLSPRTSVQAGWLSVRDLPQGDFGADLRLHWELP